LLRQRRHDVLVSDIGMPDVDGYEMLARVRSLPPAEGGQIPAIALTHFARSEDRNRALLAGFQQHLGKPVETAQLIAAASTLLRRARPVG
jgi:CheY-like chemotaxis protein